MVFCIDAYATQELCIFCRHMSNPQRLQVAGIILSYDTQVTSARLVRLVANTIQLIQTGLTIMFIMICGLQMDPAIMCAEIIKIDVPIAIRPLDNTSPPSVRTMTDFNNSGYPGTWGTPEWALMNRRVKEAIEQVMLGIFHGDIKHALFLASLQAPIKAAFDKQPADPAAPGIKLSRFSALKTQLLSHTLTQMYESAMLRLWESSVRDVINQHMASLSSHSFAMANLKQLDSTIKGLIMEEFMEVLQSKLPGAQLPASFKLSEESNHAKRRVELNGTLQKLKKATETIQAC